MKLGEEIDVSMTPYIPGLGNIRKQTHTTIAGSYLSLNVVAQSVSPKKLKNLQIKLELTKDILESNDQTALASITREDLLGDMMYAGTLSYFAQLQAQYELSAFASKANISPMFNTDPNNPTQGISTVKALQLANAQDQQIYKIDQTNIDTVLPKLNLSNSIKQDIQSSVNVGKYVITHTDNVSVPGWSGAGYAIIDPLTGSDAYMISGGENGGFILTTAVSVVLNLMDILKASPGMKNFAFVLTGLTNIISNLEALYRCLFTGTFSTLKAVALAFTILQTVMYVYMATFLIVSPLGYVYGTLASTVMEIIQGDMQGEFLDSACQ